MTETKTKEIKNAKELRAILETLPIENKDHRNSIVCSLIGHSRIQTQCFGYYNCARCEAQLGDTLASVYSYAEEVVVDGHNCSKCRKNWKKCTWKDKIYVKNPFSPNKD